jgi:hypothetical protein
MRADPQKGAQDSDAPRTAQSAIDPGKAIQLNRGFRPRRPTISKGYCNA